MSPPVITRGRRSNIIFNSSKLRTRLDSCKLWEVLSTSMCSNMQKLIHERAAKWGVGRTHQSDNASRRAVSLNESTGAISRHGTKRCATFPVLIVLHLSQKLKSNWTLLDMAELTHFEEHNGLTVNFYFSNKIRSRSLRKETWGEITGSSGGLENFAQNSIHFLKVIPTKIYKMPHITPYQRLSLYLPHVRP